MAYTVTAVGSNFTADSKANPTLAPGKAFAQTAWYLNDENDYKFYLKVKSGYKLDENSLACYYDTDTEYEHLVKKITATPISEGEYYECSIPYPAFVKNLVVKVSTYKVTDLSKCTIKAYFNGSDTANYVKYLDAFKTEGAKPESIEIYEGKTRVNLTMGSDYEVSYTNNKVAGTAYLKLTAKEGSELCKGAKEQAFTIAGIKINDTKSVSITKPASVPYNGAETKLNDELVIKNITNPEAPVILEENKDYVIAYANNTKPGKASVTIVGINGYEESTTINYTINKLNFSDAKARMDEIEIGKHLLVVPEVSGYYGYNGKQYKPEIGEIFSITRQAESLYHTMTYLKKGKDYTISYGKNVNAGTGTVTITGKGNYTGKIVRTFTIEQRDLADGSVDDWHVETTMASSFAYKNGKEIKPVPTVVLTNGKKNTKLKVNKDFKVTYPEPDKLREVGKTKLTISGMGNYKGDKTIDFYIAGKNIADKKLVTIDTTSPTAKGLLNNKPYEGKAVTLASYECEQIIKSAEPGVTLEFDRDYTVSYSNNEKAGTAKVIISGIGEYYGTKTIKMTISKVNVNQAYRDKLIIKLNGQEITSPDSLKVEYTGYAYKPTVTITDENVLPYHVLKEGTDYKVSYSNNVNAGTVKKPYATATISFKGSYAGTKEIKNIPVKFTIASWVLNDKCAGEACKLKFDNTNPTFLGGKKEVKPKVIMEILSNGAYVTVNPKAYKVTYPKNVTKSVGDVTVTIAPAKGLKDTNILPKTEDVTEKGKTKKVLIPVEKTYTISPAQILKATVSTIKPQTYKGKAVTPKVTVKYNGVTLVNGKDYKLVYLNNNSRGIGTVRINSLNSNYYDMKEVSFIIK